MKANVLPLVTTTVLVALLAVVFTPWDQWTTHQPPQESPAAVVPIETPRTPPAQAGKPETLQKKEPKQMVTVNLGPCGCCGACTTTPIRPAGKAADDPYDVVVPSGFADDTDPCPFGSGVCEAAMPGTYRVSDNPTPMAPAEREWNKSETVTADKCNCDDPFTRTNQRISAWCEDNGAGGETSIVEVVVEVAENCGLDRQTIFTYRATGPIDTSTTDFEVPFYSVEAGIDGVHVCDAATYPPSVYIREP